MVYTKTSPFGATVVFMCRFLQFHGGYTPFGIKFTFPGGRIVTHEKHGVWTFFWHLSIPLHCIRRLVGCIAWCIFKPTFISDGGALSTAIGLMPNK